MIYVGSPYTHKDPAIMDQRYNQVLAYTAKLIRNKRWCFSPIVHCHPMAQEHELPGDFNFWKEYNFYMLDRATTLHILTLPGWERSVGLQAEYDHAKETGKLVMLIPWTGK